MGGQTALNTALSLKRMGVLERYNVEMIGAKPAAIDMAEDRKLALDEIGLPAIIRPSFTWAAPAAASPTTARSSSTSSSAGSTPRPPPRC
jgi:carbamoylphosphate synthase large subunit